VYPAPGSQRPPEHVQQDRKRCKLSAPRVSSATESLSASITRRDPYASTACLTGPYRHRGRGSAWPTQRRVGIVMALAMHRMVLQCVAATLLAWRQVEQSVSRPARGGLHQARAERSRGGVMTTVLVGLVAIGVIGLAALPRTLALRPRRADRG
jgi:hypothetical protein